MDILSGIFIIVVLILAVVCVILGLLLVHINGRRQITPQQKGAVAAAVPEPPPTDNARSPAVAEQGGAPKKHFYDKDKEYFVNLWQTIKAKWQETVVLSVGLVCLLVVFSLNIFTTLVSTWLLSILCLIIVFFMVLAWQRIHKKPKTDKVAKPNDFNPVSLGILYLGFALSLWTNESTRNGLTVGIAIFFAVVSAGFLLSVYFQPIRKFMNARAAPIVLPLTFGAAILGFMLDWLPAFSSSSGIVLEVIVYFGFIWLVTILLVLYRDVKYEILRVLFMFFFIFAAALKFLDQSFVGNIAGATLLVIVILMYLVVTGRVHPYGKLEE
jgi:hypothetical protein